MHLVTSCAQVEHDQHLEGGREGEAGGEHAGRLHRLQEHGAPGGGCAGAELHAIDMQIGRLVRMGAEVQDAEVQRCKMLFLLQVIRSQGRSRRCRRGQRREECGL